MAKCPNCQKTLHFWNVKAECPHCHINIPNHNWEERLEQDAKDREAAFFRLNQKLHLLKYAVIGTPWRLIRLIFAALPLLGYLLPMAKIEGTRAFSFSVLNLFLKSETFGVNDLLSGADAVRPFYPGLVFAAGALLLAVLAFFLIFILLKHPKSPVIAVLHALSLVAYVAAAFRARSLLAGSGLGSLAIGAWLGIAAFASGFALDLLLLVLPVREDALRYVPKDELQLEYAVSIGAVDPAN